MKDNDTTVRLKPSVWEMVHIEQQLGESKSDTIGRVFQERFDVYEKILQTLEKEDELK